MIDGAGLTPIWVLECGIRAPGSFVDCDLARHGFDGPRRDGEAQSVRARVACARIVDPETRSKMGARCSGETPGLDRRSRITFNRRPRHTDRDRPAHRDVLDRVIRDIGQRLANTSRSTEAVMASSASTLSVWLRSSAGTPRRRYFAGQFT